MKIHTEEDFFLGILDKKVRTDLRIPEYFSEIRLEPSETMSATASQLFENHFKKS